MASSCVVCEKKNHHLAPIPMFHGNTSNTVAFVLECPLPHPKPLHGARGKTVLYLTVIRRYSVRIDITSHPAISSRARAAHSILHDDGASVERSYGHHILTPRLLMRALIRTATVCFIMFRRSKSLTPHSRTWSRWNSRTPSTSSYKKKLNVPS